MRGCGGALALWLATLAFPVAAEDILRAVREVDAPQGASTAEVQRLAAGGARMIYAAEVATGADDAPVRADRGPRYDGSVSAFVVLALVLGALALLLRFAGSGALVQRRPEPSRTATASPEAWNITEGERTTDAGDLMRQIAAMQDRRAAVVRLLRHCLLRAADECGTRFLRADTERAAFRRLPQGWGRHEALGHILRDAELANYGGRPVDEARFAALLDLGRSILTGRGGRVA